MLLAGLPGAGKSTLLDRLYGLRGDEREPVRAGEARVIDSRQSRNWWARYLGPVPPRARIPLVHTTHVVRIARALLKGHAVVAHDPRHVAAHPVRVRLAGPQGRQRGPPDPARRGAEDGPRGAALARPGRDERDLRPALPPLASDHRPRPGRLVPPCRERHDPRPPPPRTCSGRSTSTSGPPARRDG
ncbi:hypothetical protein [Streptosporangium vulgare]|uniref:hypothetical protein n=1 Tax=Streptosporangium vulgare TaxID=46190 RepID=UPI0031D9688E